MQLYLFNNQQNQGSGNAANGAAWQSQNYSVSDFRQYLINGSLPSSDTWGSNTNRLNSLEYTYQQFYCDANFDNDYIPNGWARSIRPGVRLVLANSNEISDFITQLGGKTLTIYPVGMSANISIASPRIVEWKVVFPTSINNTSVDLPIYSCRYIAVPVVGGNSFCGGSNFDIDSVIFHFEFSDSIQTCDDSRSSGANQMIDISVTGNFGDVPTTFNYSLGFPTPSSDVSDVVVSVPSSMRLRFDEFVSCDASFSGGVIRNDGILKIYGQLTGYGVGLLVDSGIVDEEVLICQLSFSACCDDAVTFSDAISDYLSSLMTDYGEFIGDVEITKFVYSGFGALTDYCCDDVSCSDESFNFDNNSTIHDGGSSGGGGDSGDGGTDVTCICDNLESLIDLLSDKLTSLTASVTALNTGLTSITSAISSLDVDNTSIASAINNKVIPVADTSSIVTAINNKVIPVSVVDTASIASAINNKVIPVSTVDTASITSAINSKVIPVADTSSIVTGLGNLNSDLLGIDSTLGQINSGIAGGTSILDGVDDDLILINSSIGSLASAVGGVEQAVSSSSAVDGLTCTDDEGNEVGLACILKSALNNRDGKGLADVIDDKDTSSFVEVGIEPYDLVNIRRAFKDDDLQEG